jgi:hypothetical protein
VKGVKLRRESKPVVEGERAAEWRGKRGERERGITHIEMEKK